MESYIKHEKVLDKQIQDMFSNSPESKLEILMKLVSFCIYENNTNSDLASLYKILDQENFIKVLTLFSERTIKFPPKNEVRDYFIVALIYYYREILKLEWSQIKGKFNFEINSTSYSTKVKRLKNFISQRTEEALKNVQTEKENLSGRKIF